MLEELYQGLYDDGYFYGSFEQFQEKFKDLDYRKTLHAGIVNDGDFTGDFNTFENKFTVNKFTGAATEVPAYNPETILSSSDYASPLDVVGYNIDAHTSLFNKGEGEAVRKLKELYPGFNFEEVRLGSKEGSGLDAVEISTQDGKHSATFDMNIGGLNLYSKGKKYKRKIQPREIIDENGKTTTVAEEYFSPIIENGRTVGYKSSIDDKQYTEAKVKKIATPMSPGLSEEEGRDRSFNILKDFVNKYSTDENWAAQDAAKKARRKTWEDINAWRDKLAAEEITEIEKKFKEGTLFGKEIKTKIASSGVSTMGVGSGSSVQKYEVQLYKEELERALKDLKAEYEADGNKSQPTTEEVHERALEYVIDSVQEKALTEIIETDGYQHNYSYKIGGDGGRNKATKAEKYTIAAKEFDVDFNKDYSLLTAKALELDNGVEITRFNEINSQLEDPDFVFDIMPGESVVTLQGGRQIPERIFNEFKGLNVKINNKIKAFKSFQEKVMEKAVQYSDNAAAIDIARRNYNGLEKFLTTIALGTTEMFFNATIGMNLMGGGENKDAIEFLSDFKTSTSEIRESYAKDVEFDNAFDSLTNFGTFMAQEIANQIPVFAALAIPGVGAATLGLSAFGEHYTDLSIERNSEGGRQLSNAEMWWMSAGFGASELVFESLTTIPLLKAAKRGFSITPGKKTLLDQTVGKYFKKNIGKTVYGIASEPIGEGMTQLTQNIIDGKPLTQGLDHAMFSGLMFGTTLSVAPFARGLYLSQFNDHAANIEYRQRVDKLKNLNKTNLNIKINLKAGITNAGTQADINNNNKIIADLQAENETHVREQEALVNSLSDDATKYYFALNSELEGIKNEAIEVDNNTTLTDQQRNDRLKVLQVKFDSKQRQKDFFRDKNAFGNEWDAYSGLDENADDVAALKKQAGDDLVNVNLEATKGRRKEPTEIEINQRAKFLYNVRKIKRDHAANSKAGLTNTKLFETNEDAIAWVEKQTNISEAAKAEFFKGVKDGNVHGANIPTQDGQVPFIVANNMAMDDRLETRTHEVGHSVFVKAIGSNPAAFKELSGQITEYLKQANPAAYKRLQFRLNQAGAIKDKLYDETIMVFLEEVASGKVDIAKSKQAGFLANLMNKGIEKVGGRKIDLKGETDAINFLIGIAKKIKAGTIDTKDIQAIRENRIAKQAAESAPKTKSEPATKFSKNQTNAVNELADMGWTNKTWKEQGADFAIKEMQSNKMLDGLIRSKYKADIVPDNFVDLVYSELVNHVKNFKPEQNDNLFGWINSQIANKAGNVYNREFKVADEMKGAKDIGKTTKEGEVKVQVAAEKSAEMEAFEEEDLSIEGQAKKEKADKQRYSEFRKKLGFETGSKIYNEVLDNVKKSLMMAYSTTQNITDVQLRAKAIAAKLKKEYANLNSPLFKQIKNFLTYGVADVHVKRGTKDTYISNLKKFREDIVKNISTADLVQMERNTPEADRIFTNFVKTLTSIEQVQDAVNREQLPPEALNKITKDKKTGKGAFSPSLYNKIMPTETELVSWADQPGINPVTGSRQGLKGTRKDGIAMRMVNGLVTDAIMEARQSEEVQSKIAEMDIDPGSVAELGAAIGREVNVKFSKSNAIGDISAAIDGTGDVNVYSQIKFSKSHREAYEKQLTKRRPDLTEDQRKNAVQSVFDFVDGKEIPNHKKSKYEKMAMHYTANGFLILPEDGYKVIEAERIATQKKIDPFSFKNPNELIETFVGEVKGARTNPDKVKAFTNKTELTDGVTIYDVEDSKQGQKDVRKVIDTHFGKKSNPWCLAARQEQVGMEETIDGRENAITFRDGLIDEGYVIEDFSKVEDYGEGEYYRIEFTSKQKGELGQAWQHWKQYNQEGNGHKIAFHDGKLIAFRDGNNMEWWDRNDKSTNAPVIRGKKDKDGFKPVSLVYKNKSEVIRYEKVTGDKKNGTITLKDGDGDFISQKTKKNGRTDGVSIEVDNKNKRSNNYNLKRTQNFKEGQRLDFKEERTYNNPIATEKVSFGRDEIRVDNITKYERSLIEKDWTMQAETITIEGTVNQKYFEEFQDPSKLVGFEKANIKYLTPAYERYYGIQGKKVKIVVKTIVEGASLNQLQTGETTIVTIDGVVQETNLRFSKSDVKFSRVQNANEFSLFTPSKKKKIGVYLQNLENVQEDGLTKDFLTMTRELVEDGFGLIEVFETVKAELGLVNVGIDAVLANGTLGKIHIDNIIKDIKEFGVAKIRKLGHDSSVKHLKRKLANIKNTERKIEIINEYLANVGRPTRSAKVEGITTNQLLLEEVIENLSEDVKGNYRATTIAQDKNKPEAEQRKKMQYKDGKTWKDVELYENVENIKNNAHNDTELANKVNEQAVKAQAYIFKIADSKSLTITEKKAIVQLMAYDQRGALRKIAKIGMVVDRSVSDLDSKKTVLEHEITNNDMQGYVNDYIDGKISKVKLQEIFDEARVHVLPKALDRILNSERLRRKGGRSRYNNAAFKDALQKLVDNKVIVNAKFSKSQDFQKLDKAIMFSRSTNNESKGITVLDFDDTLATTKSMIRFTRPDGTKGTLNAEQYASTYQELTELGYKWDFSEFNKVVDGKKAPLFEKALKLQDKFGPENMFILTARPAESAAAIHAFLKANGLNIPLKNITGLGNSTADAKALWVAEKVGEGYNDFYFADDALQNVKAVQNMLDQLDVKSKVQQARVKFSKNMDTEFNDILEDVTGMESKKRFSAIKGRKRGSNKGKFRFFIPPSHEDFVGLIYNFLGKGKKGDAHRNFFEKALIRPLNRANKELDAAKQNVANDYKALNKQFPGIKKKLNKKTPDGDFTYQDAIRVYIWNKHGYKIPGLSETDQAKLSELVMEDAELQAYAETLNVISKREGYVKPTEGWEAGDIRVDLDDATGREGRADYLAEFNENVDVIFSEENLNKIEAIYGKNVRSAIEDSIYRIKTGRNRPSGQNELTNRFMNYLNAAVGSVMFLNMRSALLQQLSIVNYINFADNNMFAAAKAFANVKQYREDWVKIFNSDMLKQRRGGIQTDVNAADLVKELSGKDFTGRALLAKLLQLGFTPTQIGDSIAIATGGATFYRNRVNTYLKEGLNQKEAEAKAWTDFQDITQSTQQSARPDKVSQQQASPIGKVILNFQNITSQYNRITKKALSDIYNRRTTPGNTSLIQSDISNASRVVYYLGVQNLIFYGLQTALFAVMFDDDEEEDKVTKKQERIIHGTIDSILRGSGVMGAVVATLKNIARQWMKERGKDYNPDESSVLLELLNVSPVLGIKSRHITLGEKTLNYNKKVIKEMETFDIDNPMWSAYTRYIEGITGAPTYRVYQKVQNMQEVLNNQHTALERILMFWGWTQYNLDIENKEIQEIKDRLKKDKKKSKKKKKPLSREEIRRKNLLKSRR